MKTKKGQTEIIVTVLLVLIALAAVAAIAYFITGSVNKGTAAAQDKADCLKISIVLESAKATYANSTGTITELKMSRQNDDVAIKEIKVYLNDKYVGSTATIPTKLETTTVNVVNVSTNVTVGSKVRINPVLNSTSYICEGNNEQLAVA
jgi:flagellin-like protein